MKIRFKKDTKDRRPNRNKVIPKGKELVVDDWLGEEYLKAGEAELVKGARQGVIITKPDEVEDSINKLVEKEKKSK